MNKLGLHEKLLSPEPIIELLAWTQVPPREGLSEEERKLISQPHVLAGEAARTCYSSKLCRPQDYLKESHRRITNEVIESTRESGHLTTRQHVHFTFGISGVSRQCIWSLFHSHPFYNSEQVSQRYVTMKGNYLVLSLEGEALDLYQQTADLQLARYRQLAEILYPVAEEAYFGIFPGRAHHKEKWQGEITKKAQEVARYVLPVATHANMWHTISALTLMRLARSCELYDVPNEAKIVVDKVVEEVVKQTGAGFLQEIADPLPLEGTPESAELHFRREELDFAEAKRAAWEFDEELAGKTSKLISWTRYPSWVLGQSVRAVLGVSKNHLPDEQAADLLLEPTQNIYLADTLNLTTMSKLSRVLDLISFTFAKKISHTADSQNQRHRMTPAARPILVAQYFKEPDFITPALIEAIPIAQNLYQETMEQSFAAVNQLLKLGVPFEKASYLLPNALALRFVEQGTLLNLHHKFKMRLCFNAQEEIWRASIEEADQIEGEFPQIGQWLMPPCTLRQYSGEKPHCPEGKRFCGVSVWSLPRGQYKRLI